MAHDPGSDKRRSKRRRARLALILIVDPEGEEVDGPALTFDVSQYGLGLRASAPLTPGQIVDVFSHEGREYPVRSRVVWVGEAESDREAEAGLEFLRPLPAPV